MPKYPKSMMQSAKGVYSYAKNPVKQASRVAPMCGPGQSADQNKANRLLQQQQMKESHRGKMGM